MLDDIAAEKVIRLAIAVEGARSFTLFCLWANKYFVWDHVQQIWYLLHLHRWHFQLHKKFCLRTVIYVKNYF